MDVTFADNSLRRCYQSQKDAVRRWGAKIARLYVKRINVLMASDSAQDLFTLPELKFHPLGGDRKGQYAIRLDGAWRLIVTFTNRAMTAVRVEEVSDHYDQ